jgi:putative tryptophan/tyrosine transport system substrate-binding protein
MRRIGKPWAGRNGSPFWPYAMKASSMISNAANDRELEIAFATLVQQRAAALLVSADPFFDTRRDRIVALAAQSKLPTIYQFRDFATAGGLMS